MKEAMGERIKWIDYGKAIAIFLVVLGHSGLYQPLHIARYMFGMPFFFFVSGYLFSFEKYPSYESFLMRRVKSIIVPYLFFNFVTYFFWLLVARNYGDDAVAGVVPWYVPLKGIFLGYPEYLLNDVPLWFFVCLFVVENLFYAYGKLIDKKRFVIWILVSGWIMAEVVPQLPYCINAAFVGLIFYYFGYVLKMNAGMRSVLTGWIPVFLCIAVYAVIMPLNGRIAMHDNNYGADMSLFLVEQCACFVVMYNFCLFLQKVLKHDGVLCYVGRNTLVICVMHMILFTLMKGVMVYVLDIPLSVLDGHIVSNIVFAALAVICCVPVIYVINNYLPFVIGKPCKKA